MAELLSALGRVDWRSEIRKDWPSPVDHSAEGTYAFSVFMNNLNAFTVVSAEEAETVSGTCSEFMAACNVLCAGHGSLDSPTGHLNRSNSLTSFGVRTLEVRGRRDAPDGCLAELVAMTSAAMVSWKITKA